MECGGQILPEWTKEHFDEEHNVVEFEQGYAELLPPESAD
jgi:hypothetical protein